MPYFTSNDGVRLFYDDAGQGRPLVLIHGWTFSGRFFHRNVCALAENARVITVDCAVMVALTSRSVAIAFHD